MQTEQKLLGTRSSFVLSSCPEPIGKRNDVQSHPIQSYVMYHKSNTIYSIAENKHIYHPRHSGRLEK